MCAWLFKTVCGIRTAGENRFVIAPRPGGSLTHAEACCTGIFGKVECRWEKTGTGHSYTVTVPANCEAAVRLPDGSERLQTAGTCTYITED